MPSGTGIIIKIMVAIVPYFMVFDSVNIKVEKWLFFYERLLFTIPA